MEKIKKTIKYTIFKTKWGYFGLAAAEHRLVRTVLPLPHREKVKARLLTNLTAPKYDKALLKPTQQQITAYFEGSYVNFDADTAVMLDQFSFFSKRVLTAYRDIKFRQTISYCKLAKTLNQPTAARAVGSALAKNPLPLIIPCHRIIRADHQVGGFSAPGGKKLKAKLLQHEQC